MMVWTERQKQRKATLMWMLKYLYGCKENVQRCYCYCNKDVMMLLCINSNCCLQSYILCN